MNSAIVDAVRSSLSIACAVAVAAAAGATFECPVGHRRAERSWDYDGRYILGPVGHNVCLWDAKTGHLVHTFVGHKEEIYSVCLSPDGLHVLTSSWRIGNPNPSNDTSVRLWDMKTGKEMWRLAGQVGTIYSPDGKRLLTFSSKGWKDEDFDAALWDSASGRRLATAQLGHAEPGGVELAFTPSGREFLRYQYGWAVLYDCAGGRKIAERRIGPAESFQFRGSSGNIVTLSGYGIDSWDLRSGGPPRHTDIVPRKEIPPLGWVSSWTPDGRFVVAACFGSGGRGVRVLDAERGTLVAQGTTGPDPQQPVISPDGRRFLLQVGDGSVPSWTELYDLHTCKQIGQFRLTVPEGFTPDGKTFLVSEKPPGVAIYDSQTGDLVRRLKLQGLAGPSAPLPLWEVMSAPVAIPGHMVGHELRNKQAGPCSRRYGSSARRWLYGSQVSTQRAYQRSPPSPRDEMLLKPQLIPKHSLRIGGLDPLLFCGVATQGDDHPIYGSTCEFRRSSLSFDFDGTRLLTPERHGVTLWDLQTGHPLHRFGGNLSRVSVTAFSSDGKQILTGWGYAGEDQGSTDTSVRLWDASTGRELRRFAGHKGPIEAVVFGPTGERILTADTGGKARLWDQRSGKLIAEAQVGSVREPVAFSEDGRIFLAFGPGGIGVYDAATGGLTRRIEAGKADRSGFSTARFEPGGRRIVTTALLSKEVRIWDVATGRQVGSLTDQQGYVVDAVPLPDGAHILTGSNDGTVRLWAAGTGREALRFLAPGPVHGIILSPNGKRCIAIWKYPDVPQFDHETHSSLIDVGSGREIKRQGVEATLGIVGFSPDSSTLLSVGEDRWWPSRTSSGGSWAATATLWNSNTGAKLRDVRLNP